jgi:hypothetical protein
MSLATANPILLPLKSSNLDKVESAFLSQDGMPQFHAAVALGSTSRVNGPCIDRHFNTGVCWGTFSGENTRFVANKDHDTACALEENRVWNSSVNLSPNTTNVMHTLATGGPQAAPACTARSYGTYSNCVNCSLSGASIYDCQCSTSNPNTIWSTNPSM